MHEVQYLGLIFITVYLVTDPQMSTLNVLAGRKEKVMMFSDLLPKRGKEL